MKLGRLSARAGLLAMVLFGLVGWKPALADAPRYSTDCSALPSHAQLVTALQPIVAQGGNGGFGTNEWVTVVNRDGYVCAVAFSGATSGDQMPAGRAMSEEKAYTANAMSLPSFALSTANLYSAAQPGSMMYGVNSANTFNTEAVAGNPADFGQYQDPMVGRLVGGLTSLAGGLALYNAKGQLVGGVGLGGDLPCSDHIIAWKLRHALSLDYVPYGVSPTHDDNIINDITADPATGISHSANGYGYPVCTPAATTSAASLPTDYPLRGR